MRRTCLLVLAVVASCKGTGKDEAAKVPAGSAGSAASATPAPAAKPIDPPTGPAPKLVWKDTDGELLLATGDGATLTGPCGLAGTLTPTEVAIGGQKPEGWNKVLRDGRAYSFPNLDWVITVAPSGEVTLAQHGAKKPLGTVSGLDSDAAAAWFGAFIVAAPMVQHELVWESTDGASRLVLGGAADLRAWQVTEGTTKLASRQREDPAPLAAGDKPAWNPLAVDVKIDVPKTYVVYVKRDDAATKAAFAAETYKVTEAADGTLALDGKPLGKLIGRKACRAHDQAVPALLWTLFATKAGHAKVFGA